MTKVSVATPAQFADLLRLVSACSGIHAQRLQHPNTRSGTRHPSHAVAFPLMFAYKRFKPAAGVTGQVIEKGALLLIMEPQALAMVGVDYTADLWVIVCTIARMLTVDFPYILRIMDYWERMPGGPVAMVDAKGENFRRAGDGILLPSLIDISGLVLCGQEGARYTSTPAYEDPLITFGRAFSMPRAAISPRTAQPPVAATLMQQLTGKLPHQLEVEADCGDADANSMVQLKTHGHMPAVHAVLEPAAQCLHAQWAQCVRVQASAATRASMQGLSASERADAREQETEAKRARHLCAFLAELMVCWGDIIRKMLQPQEWMRWESAEAIIETYPCIKQLVIALDSTYESSAVAARQHKGARNAAGPGAATAAGACVGKKARTGGAGAEEGQRQ